MKIKKLAPLIAVTFCLALTSIAQDLGKIDPIVQKQIGASLTSYYALKDASGRFGCGQGEPGG